MAEDPLDSRRNLTGYSSAGTSENGSTRVWSGILLKDETVAPGETLTLTFDLDAAWTQELLGPTRVWIPMLWSNETPTPTQPDSIHYPIIVLPR